MFETRIIFIGTVVQLIIYFIAAIGGKSKRARIKILKWSLVLYLILGIILTIINF